MSEFKKIELKYLYRVDSKNNYKYDSVISYMSFFNFSQFDVTEGEMQRKVDIEHVEKLEEFLKDSSKFRYLPFVTMSFRVDEFIKDNSINYKYGKENLNNINNRDIRFDEFKKYTHLIIKNKEALKYFKILDGNHRLSAIKKLINDGKNSESIIPVNIIINPSIEDELSTFYNMNSKGKNLVSDNFVNDVFMNYGKRLNDDFLNAFLFAFNNLKNIFDNACDYANSADKLIKLTGILENEIEMFCLEVDSFYKKNKNTVDDFIYKKDNNIKELIILLFTIIPKIKNNDENEIIKFIEYCSDYTMVDVKEVVKHYEEFKKYHLNNIIFLAMPFRHDIHYKGNDIHKALKSIVTEEYGELKRVDDEPLSENIINKIFKYLEKSKLVLIDLTLCTPNVIYEYGLAKGMKKDIILFKSTDCTKKLPFDIIVDEHFKYDGIEDLKSNLKEKLDKLYLNP